MNTFRGEWVLGVPDGLTGYRRLLTRNLMWWRMHRVPSRIAKWVPQVLRGYWLWRTLADMHTSMVSSDRSRLTLVTALAVAFGTILALLVLLAAVFALRARTNRREIKAGAGDTAAGKASPRGPGSPALGVPIFFPTKREGLGSHGDHKQPPSPIQGFTEVTLPVSSSIDLAPPTLSGTL